MRLLEIESVMCDIEIMPNNEVYGEIYKSERIY